MNGSVVARASRILAIVLGAVLLLFVCAAGTLWWWSGSEGSLEWVLRRVAQSQPLTVDGVQGSLRDGLHVQRLTWEKDGLRVEADDVRLAWQPVALLGGVVQLDNVQAAAVRITDKRPAPTGTSQPPLTLAMGLRLALDEFKIARIEWAGKFTAQVDDVAGRYAFDGAAHQVRLESLKYAGGTYRGEGSIAARAPLDVTAKIEGAFAAPVPGAAKQLPLEFTAKFNGPLTDLQAVANLQAPPGKAAGSEVPHATATARITPWATQPLPQARADLSALDLAALWPQAPRTKLGGHLQVNPSGTGTWQISADLRNELPGAWDQQKLPVEHVKGQGQWQGGVALIEDLHARIGGGEVHAKGQWESQAKEWKVQGQLSGINPAQLHTRMAATPLGGRFDARHAGDAIVFDVDLQGAGAKRADALDLRKLTVTKGRWSNGKLSLPTLQIISSDAILRGTIEAEPSARAGRGQLELHAPGLLANANGDVAQARGRGIVQFQGSNLALAQQWLARLPGLEAAREHGSLAGRAEATLGWQGGWEDPTVQAKLSSSNMQWQGTADANSPPWVIRDTVAALEGRLADARLVARARAQQGQREVAIDISGRGGRAPLRRGSVVQWQGSIAALNLSLQDPGVGAGAWRLSLQRAFDWRWLPEGKRFQMSAGQAVLHAPAVKGTAAPSQATLSWEPVRWGGGELRTAGKLAGLPLGWLELVGGPQLAGSALSGDMVFDAQWDASLGQVVKINASIARSRGDITVLAESVQGLSSRVPAGVRDARLTLVSQGEQVTLALRWDSERAGTADGRLVTRLSRGGQAGWQWADNAPIDASLKARLPRIGVWSLLAPPGWRLRGSLAADVKAAGTRADPRLSGSIAADDLALRSVVDGVELRDGRLRASLQGNRVAVGEFTLHGAGERGSGGTLSASGEAAWVQGAPFLQARVQLTRLRASIRSDRQLTLSGNASARMDAKGTEVTGKIKVDQALFVLPDESEPKLGDDVVVRGKPSNEDRKASGASPATAMPTAAPSPASKRALSVAVDVDLGEDFQVRGRGLQSRLRGTLALTGRSLVAPSLNGVITTAGGEFRAYNQHLMVERGVLRFTGRIDNPSLDILAIRPNLTQRVGVLVSGTAQAPFVRLYAEPELPDAEKLAWLVTGRAAPSTGAEAALVQQAALAFLSSRRPGSKGVAQAVGLDELSVRRDTSEGAVVTLGKRFAQNFYASYERSLSGALGTLFIFYDVSRRLTVRAQAGERAGVDLIFTFSFD